jgi:hypothetical protein
VLVTDVPEELSGRQISPRQHAHGFDISLDTAEPWGGGRIEGRVEAREGRHDPHPISVSVRCFATWLDVAPQLVGQKRLRSVDTWFEIRSRAIPIWIEEEVFLERFELGPLDAATNWVHFAMDLPPELPRALEGTFVSFRWRLEATRERRIGHDTASLPLLLRERRELPVVRVETSPLGHWRLLEWKAEAEMDAEAGPCSVAFEERRPEDMPRPGETPEQERIRLTRGG